MKSITKLNSPTRSKAKEPYRLVMEDEIHPAPRVRESKVNDGWKDASIKYDISSSSINLSRYYQNSVDLFFTIAALPKGIQSVYTDSLTASVLLTRDSLDNVALMKNIKSVTYCLYQTCSNNENHQSNINGRKEKSFYVRKSLITSKFNNNKLSKKLKRKNGVSTIESYRYIITLNQGQSENFGYTISVCKSFPIEAKIVFSDNSSLTVVKSFAL